MYGTTTLTDIYQSIVNASLHQTSFQALAPIVFPAVEVAALAWCLYLAFARKEREAREGRPQFALIVAAVIVTTLTVHWLAFRFFGLLLPVNRTAIYLFPLSISAIGALAAISSRFAHRSMAARKPHRIARPDGRLFPPLLRLDYFAEWPWDADVRETYSVLDCLNRTTGVNAIASSWPYQMPLNFYRLARHSAIPEISDESWNRENMQIFVVDTLHTPDVLGRRALESFYRGKSTDLVLAAEPVLAQTLRANPCVAQ